MSYYPSLNDENKNNCFFSTRQAEKESEPNIPVILTSNDSMNFFTKTASDVSVVMCVLLTSCSRPVRAGNRCIGGHRPL